MLSDDSKVALGSLRHKLANLQNFEVWLLLDSYYLENHFLKMSGYLWRHNFMKHNLRIFSQNWVNNRPYHGLHRNILVLVQISYLLAEILLPTTDKLRKHGNKLCWFGLTTQRDYSSLSFMLQSWIFWQLKVRGSEKFGNV